MTTKKQHLIDADQFIDALRAYLTDDMDALDKSYYQFAIDCVMYYVGIDEYADDTANDTSDTNSDAQ